MKTSRQRLGSWGEDLAANFLRERGFEILGRNVRTAYGEIDLVACRSSNFTVGPSPDCSTSQSAGSQACQSNPDRSSPLVVFVEVKTRTSTEFGYPEASITPAKQVHLLASAREYLRLHPDLDGDWRVDVIAILHPDPLSSPEIRHFENAVTSAGSP